MTICAFLGLGVMGFPMAGHLARAGHEVRVWNRTGAKADLWAKTYADAPNAKACASIEESVNGADIVLMCVGNDADVMAVATKAIPAMSEGGVCVDHTTASAGCARECFEQAKSRGISFVDAPISGGEAGAVNGQLTIMCGGTDDGFKRALPIMDVYGKAVKHMGESGAGQMTKMVNQICIAGTLQGLSEGLNFARKAGLDITEVVDAIGKGAAQSWQMDNRAATIAKDEFDFGFAIDWMRKDLGIAISAAKEVDADMTVTKLVDQYYAEVQDMGGSRWDTSALIKRLK